MKTELEDKFTMIRKGLLEFLVLKIVSNEKVYAADILKTLNETDFSTQEGTLYPLLSKMRRDDLLNYEWQESESGPPRKYYSLTSKGNKQLKNLNEYWQTLHKTVNEIGR